MIRWGETLPSRTRLSSEFSSSSRYSVPLPNALISFGFRSIESSESTILMTLHHVQKQFQSIPRGALKYYHESPEKCWRTRWQRENALVPLEIHVYRRQVSAHHSSMCWAFLENRKTLPLYYSIASTSAVPLHFTLHIVHIPHNHIHFLNYRKRACCYIDNSRDKQNLDTPMPDISRHYYVHQRLLLAKERGKASTCWQVESKHRMSLISLKCLV